jgi:hypothetical protein
VFQTTLETTIKKLQGIANTTLDDEFTAALNAFNKSQLEDTPITGKRKLEEQQKEKETEERKNYDDDDGNGESAE